MFNEEHVFLSFATGEDRSKYWVGRLVKAKVPIKKNLFDSIPVKCIGLVTNVEKNYDEHTFLLVVKWADGSLCPCYQHSIFSHNVGQQYDKA